MEDTLLSDLCQAPSNAKEDALTEAKVNSPKEDESTEVDKIAGAKWDVQHLVEQEASPGDSVEETSKKETSGKEPEAEEEEEGNAVVAPEETVPPAPAEETAEDAAEVDEEYHSSTMSALSEERWDEMYQRLLKFKVGGYLQFLWTVMIDNAAIVVAAWRLLPAHLTCCYRFILTQELHGHCLGMCVGNW